MKLLNLEQVENIQNCEENKNKKTLMAIAAK